MNYLTLTTHRSCAVVYAFLCVLNAVLEPQEFEDCRKTILAHLSVTFPRKLSPKEQDEVLNHSTAQFLDVIKRFTRTDLVPAKLAWFNQTEELTFLHLVLASLLSTHCQDAIEHIDQSIRVWETNTEKHPELDAPSKHFIPCLTKIKDNLAIVFLVLEEQSKRIESGFASNPETRSYLPVAHTFGLTSIESLNHANTINVFQTVQSNQSTQSS